MKISKKHKLKTVEEKVKIAEDIAQHNNGLLPYSRWLTRHGYSSILPTIKKYPEKFKHIKREYKQIRKPIRDHVKLAEKLAKEHGSILYPVGWLNKNGYAGLVSAMRRHPEKFKHIKQEKL
jgi:hypothetical protein